MVYKPKGVCSQLIEVEADENGVITKVQFTGGCNGNTQGVSRLTEGMKIDDAIAKMKGIRCGVRGTSCPDQLAKALKQYKEEKYA